MSKRYPECPKFDHDKCKDVMLPKVCAIVREDQRCLREQPKKKDKD